MVIFGSCLLCIYYKAFGYKVIMPLWSTNLHLPCGWLGMECLDEFALVPSGGGPISGTCKVWTPSGVC